MSLLKKLSLYFTILLFSLCSLTAKQDYKIEDQPHAFTEAITLPNQGILKQKDNRFVYLDVSNKFITNTIPLLDYEGLLRPRLTSSKSMGAHICVFNEKEEIKPVELGLSFSFEVQEIRNFTMHTRNGLKKLWVIAVRSPELEQLRKSYGLSPKLKGHDFHITLAKQMPSAPEGWDSIETLSPFNFSGDNTDGLLTEGDYVTVNNSDILSTAAKVDAIGQLKLKGNGFVYVDVDNKYIDNVIDKLPIRGEFKPVSTKPKRMGAHISVFYEDEMIKNEIWTLHEAGEWFTFEVKELRYIDRKTSNGQKRLWLLAAQSPALERLRLNYGLKPKLKGHDFHITLGSEQIENAKSIQVEANAA